MLCFAIKWAGQKKVSTHALPDYGGYSRNRHNDKQLASELHKILDAADIVVAHNGDAFDIKKINSRFLVHGLPPPSPYKTIDTLKIARKHFKFDSNRLDNLGRYLGVGRKLPNTGATLWRGCVDGDADSWRLMRKYNAQDVALLERVYERLKAWAPSHPDLRLFDQSPGCPTCRSFHVVRRGVAISRSRRYQRFQCQDCAAWFQGQPIPPTKSNSLSGSTMRR